MIDANTKLDLANQVLQALDDLCNAEMNGEAIELTQQDIQDVLMLAVQANTSTVAFKGLLTS